MPLKIEIVLPAAELDSILPGIEEIVTEGIVAVRDLDIRSHRTRAHLIPRHMRVKDVMTPYPVSVTGSSSVTEVVKILLKSNYNAVPVVAPENRTVGIITQGDLITRSGMPIRLGLLSEFEKEKTEIYFDSISKRTAVEIMTSPVMTVDQEKHLGEAVDLMLKNGLKRMPVVMRTGAVPGYSRVSMSSEPFQKYPLTGEHLMR
jgi:CBS domain-containing protein